MQKKNYLHILHYILLKHYVLYDDSKQFKKKSNKGDKRIIILNLKKS